MMNMARKEFETLTPQMFYILLALYKPMHGYDIMQKVKELTSGEIQIGAGTLYSLLPRFEQEYYIRLVKEENKRKIYQITKNGKEKLRQEKERMSKQIELLQEVSSYEET